MHHSRPLSSLEHKEAAATGSDMSQACWHTLQLAEGGLHGRAIAIVTVSKGVVSRGRTAVQVCSHRPCGSPHDGSRTCRSCPCCSRGSHSLCGENSRKAVYTRYKVRQLLRHHVLHWGSYNDLKHLCYGVLYCSKAANVT
jgi:hypothetical protein